MKFYNGTDIYNDVSVAPCAGAGIEMLLTVALNSPQRVAPCAGAGIEIHTPEDRPARRPVAPCAGAGIEITAYTPRSLTR